MARPKKQTVDYFPHMCIHKKTLYIIEQKYGNDGYAFWFKLLETLGVTEGHVLDLNDETAWEFLQAKTLISEDLCAELMDLLARLGAIDKDLWKEKIVWSQNFVDNVSDAYKNRKSEIPVKPSFYGQKPQQSEVSTADNTHSIQYDTKPKDIKPKDIKPKEIKTLYLDCVLLTSDEHQKLITEFGQVGTSRIIEILNNYKGSTSKTYKSDYLAIKNWVVTRYKEEMQKQGKKVNDPMRVKRNLDDLME